MTSDKSLKLLSYKLNSMDIAEILKIAGILSGIVLGIIGAVPQIRKWFKPKPHLVLQLVNLKLLSPHRMYRLNLVLSNDARFLRRTVDATKVDLEYHVIDANYEQRVGFGTFHLSRKLPIGESVNIAIDFHPSCKEEYNHHPLILTISCEEGQKIKHEISFDCS